MSSSTINPPFTAACAAMNRLVAETYLPQEAYEEIYHPESEAEYTTDLGERVARIVSTKPAMALADGRELHGDPCSNDCLDLFVRERMIYPRMQRLHSLLCAGKDPERVSVVENGSGGVPHISMVLSAMGYHIAVKDPDSRVMLAQRRFSMTALPKDWLGRIAFFSDSDTVEIDTPSNVVYWANPSNRMFMHLQKPKDRTPERLAQLASYMGRDVILGGYLVLQSEDDLYGGLPFDESTWQAIFDTTERGFRPIRGAFLPTFCYGIDNHLRIFRRIA